MYQISLPYAANTPGTNTLVLLLDEIKSQLPELALTTVHYIKRIQHYSKRRLPDRSMVTVGSNIDKHFEVQVVYNRYSVDSSLVNPLFTPEELETVQPMDENELIAFIASKLTLNLTPVEFMVVQDGITYTGGDVQPNWRLVARHDSPFWYGDKVLWLHDGGPVFEPE